MLFLFNQEIYRSLLDVIELFLTLDKLADNFHCLALFDD